MENTSLFATASTFFFFLTTTTINLCCYLKTASIIICENTKAKFLESYSQEVIFLHEQTLKSPVEPGSTPLQILKIL